MAGKTIRNYGTIMKGLPLSKNQGKQQVPLKSTGKSPYPNGTSTRAKGKGK